MLEGNNTTISIAHRLSTIQRSDRIICIGTDGKVAQTGTYRELSEDKDGAFAKLMEWQMSGGTAPVPTSRLKELAPGLTEEERMKKRLEEHDEEQWLDHAEGAEDEVGEGTAVRKEKQTAPEAVLERTNSTDR